MSSAVVEQDRRLATLLADAEAATGPAAWPRVETLVTALVDLYGRVLERVLGHARAAAPGAAADFDARLGEDVMVASVLALHEIHPVPLERRVARALERVRAQNPGAAPLVLERIDDGTATLRADGEGPLPPVPWVTRAMDLHAPEIARVRIAGAEPALVPVERLRRGGTR